MIGGNARSTTQLIGNLAKVGSCGIDLPNRFCVASECLRGYIKNIVLLYIEYFVLRTGTFKGVGKPAL